MRNSFQMVVTVGARQVELILLEAKINVLRPASPLPTQLPIIHSNSDDLLAEITSCPQADATSQQSTDDELRRSL